MIRWEYSTVVVEGADIQTSIPWLDQAGSDGWEVIHVQQTSYGMVYLVKKPLPLADVQDGMAVKHSHSTLFMCSSSCPHYGTVNELKG